MLNLLGTVVKILLKYTLLAGLGVLMTGIYLGGAAMMEFGVLASRVSVVVEPIAEQGTYWEIGKRAIKRWWSDWWDW